RPVRPGGAKASQHHETGGCVYQVTLQRAPDLATRENQWTLPQLGKSVGFLNDSRQSDRSCTAMERPRVAAVKVKNMLAMTVRVNPKTLLDHEFSGQPAVRDLVNPVALAQWCVAIESQSD